MCDLNNLKKELTTFGEIELSKKVLAAISDMGFEEPSPIQSKTIPLVLAGNDVIGQAQTGTGKTAAFGIPAIEKVDDHNKHIHFLFEYQLDPNSHVQFHTLLAATLLFYFYLSILTQIF